MLDDDLGRDGHGQAAPNGASEVFPRRNCGDLIPLSTRVSNWACISPKRGPAGPVRCRTCGPCLAMRQWQWKRRVMFEASLCARSWWVTLTVRPGDGVIYTPDVSDALKRLDEAFPMRYVAIEENGSRNGRLHWHVLCHFGRHDPNRRGDPRPSRREVEDALEWPHGFSKIELVREAGAVGRYLSKYMTKDKGSIKGQSLRYGRGYEPHPRGSEAVAEVFRCFPQARILRTRATPWRPWLDAFAFRKTPAEASLMARMKRAERLGQTALLIALRREWYSEVARSEERARLLERIEREAAPGSAADVSRATSEVGEETTSLTPGGLKKTHAHGYGGNGD